MSIKTVRVLSAVLSLIGLIGFVGGLRISWAPTYVIRWGYTIFSIGVFGLVCPDGCWRLRAFRIFLLCWAAGALATTMLYLPRSVLAMFSTIPIHMLLLAIACRVALGSSRWRHVTKPIYVAAFLLALILPHYLVVTFEKPYPIYPESIEVSDDSVEEKKPPYIDDGFMWHEGTVQSKFHPDSLTYRINKSAAVIGLDLGKYKDDEKEHSETLFTTYRQALSYARENDLPVIPSVQLIDHKAKLFGDELYAAIETHIQSEAEHFGDGKQGFLREVLTALRTTKDRSPGQAEATAYIAAGLHLGGQELPELPEETDRLRQKLESDFLSKPLQSKPIGFYTESEELKRIFQQDRFYQTPLTHAAAISLARVMVSHPELRKRYQFFLALYSRLTNPPSRFSVDDVAEYPEYFDDLPALKEQMLKSKKWGILKQRGAGRGTDVGSFPCVQFLPHSTSKENQWFARIYNYSTELPRHNVMNRLIRAIRSGGLDLTPTDDSGWYDYQIHALETLLVMEKGQENEKLLLSKDYQQRLIEAFKTILTKKRELHVKQVELIPTSGASLGPQYFTISPDLSVEPMATYYLRTARGFRFLLGALELILGKTCLEGIAIEDSESLPVALDNMSKLYYGLYIQVCDDIGMAVEFLPGEMSEAQIAQAKQQADQWLKDYEAESFCAQDVRFMVPALTNLDRTEVRYWMVVGVKLLKIRAEYVRRPQVEILDKEKGEVIGKIPTEAESGRIPNRILQYRFAPEEYYLPIEVFTEATGSAEPLTREEFRALCNQYKNKEEIIAAIESSATFKNVKPLIMVVIASVLIIASIALFPLIKKRRKERISL